MADPQAFAYLQVDPQNRSERLTLESFDLLLRPFHHDMATIVVYAMEDTDFSRWTAGVPLKVTYGRAATSETFYGYILEVNRLWSTEERRPPSFRPLQVTAIGTSYWLKQPLSELFRGLSTAHIARKLARANFLDFDIPVAPSDYIWPVKSAPGVSQWAFLVDLAKASGLTLYVKDTQLRMYDALTILRRNLTTIPVFYDKDTSNINSVAKFETNLVEVSSTEGRKKRGRVVNSLDQLTGAPIYVSDSGQSAAANLALRYQKPVFSEIVTDLVTDSQSTAGDLLSARSIENRFPSRAEATVLGDLRITQDSPVVFEGLGRRDSGLWQALTVKHCVRKNLFMTELELGRDSDYDNGNRPGPPANIIRPHLDPYATTIFNVVPPVVLVNGRWRSAWSPSSAVAS